MKRVCCVCNKHLAGDPNDPQVSHGYCRRHLAEAHAQIDAWEARKRQEEAAKGGRGGQ